jgi:hypothetical protein
VCTKIFFFKKTKNTRSEIRVKAQNKRQRTKKKGQEQTVYSTAEKGAKQTGGQENNQEAKKTIRRPRKQKGGQENKKEAKKTKRRPRKQTGGQENKQTKLNVQTVRGVSQRKGERKNQLHDQKKNWCTAVHFRSARMRVCVIFLC